MDKLVSKWSNGETVPVNYVFPPGERPGEYVAPTSKAIPVIDLGKSEGDDRKRIVQQIIEAAQRFGFFLVINHGVEKRLLDDAMSMFKGFFELPDEDKSSFCSGDYNQKCVLYTSNVFYEKEGTHYWRDALKHVCNPLEESMQYWPQKPARYREVVGEYAVKVRELGAKILELISEGLGLEPSYFATKLSQDADLTVNYYPPCPDPSLTWGVKRHCDINLITILLQGDIPGLQVLKDGEWIGVEPIPDAFVVNMGFQMQIVSNGMLKSAEHRAVTNAHKTRISVPCFISPTKECYVEPAKALVSAENPPIYKGFRYEEFHEAYVEAHCGKVAHPLAPYMIKY